MTKNQNDIYQEITDRILALLAQGVAPWNKPWRAQCFGGECGVFFNLATRKPYHGVNILVLSAAGFTSPWFATFNQIKKMGGMVKRGARSTPIVFWKRVPIKDKDDPEKTKIIPFLRESRVFNVLEQTTGLEDKIPQADRPATPEEAEQIRSAAMDEADNIVENMPKRPDIFHGGDRACYSPFDDVVRMPNPKTFIDLEHYYSVLFHELTHATGHHSRLARKALLGDWTSFGSTDYAKEELVAEMGAAFICGHLGIENTIETSASYLDHWSRQLKADPKLFVHAAGAAQKAADFILRRERGGWRDDETTEPQPKDDDETLTEQTS